MSVSVTLAQDWDGWEPGNHAEIQVREDGIVQVRPVEFSDVRGGRDREESADE